MVNLAIVKLAKNQRTLTAEHCPCGEISPYFTQHLEISVLPSYLPSALVFGWGMCFSW